MGGHKIFISYKYHDTNVFQMVDEHLLEQSQKRRLVTPRDYVNVLAEYLDEHSPHYCKAEEDDNDLENKSEEQIWEYLKDKMFDSTMTIVLISPNMKEGNKKDREQWIPWEVQYSLGIETRHNSSGNPVRSFVNAMMAIVLPDKNNSYEYYFETKNCKECSNTCMVNKTDGLFYILKMNTFNKIQDESSKCKSGDKIYTGDMNSYIPFYKWCDVNTKGKIETAIEHSYDIQSQIEKYEICHEIDEK